MSAPRRRWTELIIGAALPALALGLAGADVAVARAADLPAQVRSQPTSGELPSEPASDRSSGDASSPNTAERSKAACVARHQSAQILRRDRQLIAARAALRACSGAACPAAVRADCIQWLDEVGRSLPSLVVTAGAGGTDLVDVRVFIDGQLATARLSGAALDVDPGEHHLRLESPPWSPVERTILVSEGVKGRAIDVDFAPATPPREIRTPPVLDYILGGVTLASLSTFAAFGISALYDRQRLQQSCAPFCSQDEVNPVRMKLIIADTALGVAVTSLAIGLYLRAVRPVAPRRSAQRAGAGLSALLGASATGAGVDVAGVF